LLLDNSTLEFAEELFTLGKRQAELLYPLMLLGQDDEILGPLGAILGNAHELDLELDGHRCAPQGRRSRHDTRLESLAGRPCP